MMPTPDLLALLQAFADRFMGHQVEERMIVNFLKDMGVIDA